MELEEQIMFKDEYPSIFLLQMEASVFNILQIFFAVHSVLKIGNITWIFLSFGWEIFSQVMHLDQLVPAKLFNGL